MQPSKCFCAYPSRSLGLVRALSTAFTNLNASWGEDFVHGWEENDIAGRFLTDPIFGEIDRREILLADITFLNFNVSYEIGYAIGRGKPAILLRNTSFDGDAKLYGEVGIYDTLAQVTYANSQELVQEIVDVKLQPPLKIDQLQNRVAPIYYLGSLNRNDSLLHLQARLKKTKYRIREFNPYEQGRLSPPEAIENVSSSALVVVPLLSTGQTGHFVHNIRAAFVSGLAHGMGKACLILQAEGGPIPLDVRDLVTTFKVDQQIDDAVAGMLPTIVEALQESDVPVAVDENILSRLDLGQYVAENESATLNRYYLVTEQFRTVLAGSVRLVVGRKGSGKSALFMQARDRWRPNKNNVVVELKPEAFKLRKLRDIVLHWLAEGSRDQLLTAFWEYLLLLEVCSSVLEEDYQIHLRNHELYQPFRQLADLYRSSGYEVSSDFSERMVQLIDRLADRYEERYGTVPNQQLSENQLIQLLYEHDIRALRRALTDYMNFKEAAYIVFDNLDKGWSSDGLRAEDIVIVRGLIAAAEEVERFFRKIGSEAHVVIFLRNDVYELLVDSTPDRGKEHQVAIDWYDRELLRLMVQKRFAASKLSASTDFDYLWGLVSEQHVHGEASFEYLMDRCLMRPRYLLRILKACRSAAINRQGTKITEHDIDKGLEEFSNALVLEADREIRDIFPEAQDVMYNLIREPRVMSRAKLVSLFPAVCQEPAKAERLFDLMLWFGVIGLRENEDKVTYIYDSEAGYSLKKLKALVAKATNALFRINPAFEPGLGATAAVT